VGERWWVGGGEMAEKCWTQTDESDSHILGGGVPGSPFLKYQCRRESTSTFFTINNSYQVSHDLFFILAFFALWCTQL
jgi:hypothetical protein